MQPPGRPVGSSTPLGAKTPGAGHVFAVIGMRPGTSIWNGALRKLLWKVVAVVASVHVAGCGGVARFTSSCSRHV